MKAFVAQHFEDFVNNNRPEVIHENMTDDFYDHDGPGGKPTDAGGDERMMRGMQQAIHGLHVEIDHMVAEGDRVICKNRWSGINSQTGKQIQFHGYVEWRFEGAKIAERWATVTSPTETEP